VWVGGAQLGTVIEAALQDGPTGGVERDRVGAFSELDGLAGEVDVGDAQQPNRVATSPSAVGRGRVGQADLTAGNARRALLPD
jgi:hypothetical protein